MSLYSEELFIGEFWRYKFEFLSWGLIFEILQYTFIEFRLPGFQSFILWLLLLNVAIYFFSNWNLYVFWLSTFGSTFWNDLCRNLFVSFILVGGFKILAFRTGASLHMPTLRNKDVSFSFAYQGCLNTGSPRSKYKYRRTSTSLHNIRNTLYKDLYGKKPIVFVTYENERISIKNSLPYLISPVWSMGRFMAVLWVV